MGDESIPDELKIHVDEDKVAEWDKVRDEYSAHAGDEAVRPEFADPEKSGTQADEAGSDAESGSVETGSED